MTVFQLAAAVVTLTAAFAYLNARLLRLPTSVGLMALALFGSLALIALDGSGVIELSPRVRQAVADLNFGNTLLHGMLGLLLFAGALHINLEELGTHKLAVTALALGSTLISTVLVGGATYLVLDVIGIPIRPIDGFLFGALISPTDPIAVLGMLKSAGAPPELRVRIAGESLFNDAIGVVVFTVMMSLAAHASTSAGDIAVLFVHEALGGAAFGLATGYLAFRMLRGIDDYSVEVLITLALVLGGYATAEALHVSAPMAAIVAGLVIGNQGRRTMSERSRMHVDLFWNLIDEILNAVLFLMIGLVVLLVPITAGIAGAMTLAIPIVLVSRLVSIAIPMRLLGPLRASTPHSITILTWGGLRGGLSIAMALSLPGNGKYDVVVVMTYAVVAFSILVQGMTFKRLLRRLGLVEEAA